MRILTVEDLKTMLSITENKAKALVRLPDFPAIQIGSEHRVLEEDLYQWIRDNRNSKIKLDYNKI